MYLLTRALPQALANTTRDTVESTVAYIFHVGIRRFRHQIVELRCHLGLTYVGLVVFHDERKVAKLVVLSK